MEMATEEIQRRLLAGIAEKLKDRRLTLCTAESCTGGLVGALCTSLPGSSAWFKGGIIAYDNELKERLLGVPAEILRQYGAVSKACAGAMLAGALRACSADCAIAITGIAGPDGGSAAKPVGFVVIGVAVPDKTAAHKEVIISKTFSGDRAANRLSAATKALQMLDALVLNLVRT
jgi:PncC family amidohydrolase